MRKICITFKFSFNQKYNSGLKLIATVYTNKQMVFQTKSNKQFSIFIFEPNQFFFFFFFHSLQKTTRFSPLFWFTVTVLYHSCRTATKQDFWFKNTKKTDCLSCRNLLLWNLWITAILLWWPLLDFSSHQAKMSTVIHENSRINISSLGTFNTFLIGNTPTKLTSWNSTWNLSKHE